MYIKENFKSAGHGGTDLQFQLLLRLTQDDHKLETRLHSK